MRKALLPNQASKRVLKRLLAACSLLLFCIQTLSAQDYNITNTDGKLVITDLIGNDDIFSVSQSNVNVMRLTTNPVKTYVMNGGGSPQNISNLDLSLSGFNEIIFNTGGGNDKITFTNMTRSALPSLTLNGGTGNDAVTMSSMSFTSGASLDIDMQNDDPSPGDDMVAFPAFSNVVLTGTGSAVIRVSKNITVSTGASLETADGNLVVETNQQDVPTAGVFIGIDFNNAQFKVTGSGSLTVKARGGTDPATTTGQIGLRLQSGAKIIGGASGPVLVQGSGGGGVGNSNYGVHLTGSGSNVTSTGGNVQVVGTGGGSGAGKENMGIIAQFNAGIIGVGNASVTVTGTGGGGSGINQYGVSLTGTATITSAAGTLKVNGTGGPGTGVGNCGVVVNSVSASTATALITSSGGDVEVTGLGGGSGASTSNHGVFVTFYGKITAGGNGAVKVQGTGGPSSGTGNFGVYLLNTGSTITSTNGPVYVKGQGGGTGSAGSQYGVSLLTEGTIVGGGNGTVLVEGTGGNTASTGNNGVNIQGTNTKIASTNGDLEIIGVGGGPNTTSSNHGINATFGAAILAGGAGSLKLTGTGASGTGSGNTGIKVDNSGKISAEGTGNVTFNGTGGKCVGNNNYGVWTNGVTLVTSAGGNVTINGQGGGAEAQGSSSNNHGLFMSGGTIRPGGNGVLHIEGKGGNGLGNSNTGVNAQSGSLISSSGGDVEVNGTGGGSGSSSNNFGIVVISGGKVSAGGSGNVNLLGIGSPNAGTGNSGVLVQDGAAEVSSSGGNVSITGVENNASANSMGLRVQLSAIVTTVASGGDITLIANSLDVPATGTVITDLNHKVTVRPYTDNVSTEVGSTANSIGGPLRISDAEFDRMTTGKLVIGNAQAGYVNIVAPITRAASTNMELHSGKNISFSENINTNGGNLLLHPGNAPAAMFPDFTGTDADLGAGTLSFGSDLGIKIYGATPGNDFSKHTQLKVIGQVDLTGVNLVLSGNYALQPGDALVIVDNDGTDPIQQTFNGLAEGAIISGFPSPGQKISITYLGGDGNDVVLTAASPCTGYGDHIYVKADATGANSGMSWQDAFASLQDALETACNCESITQVWVAKGTYYPDEGSTQTANARQSTFRLCDNVSVYGGFAGTESTLDDRNPAANETVLSGDLAQNDSSDPSSYQENAYHVVSGSQIGATTALSGFRISGGNANGSFPDNSGGGLFIDMGSPGLDQCIISGNMAVNGAGMYNQQANPTIVNCLFSGNLANQHGGGIYNNISSPSLVLVTISGNNAPADGGAIYNEGASNPTISNSIIHGNSSGIAPAAVSVGFSLVQGYTGSANGNLDGDTDPGFENTVGGYVAAPFAGGDYRLRTCSPAVNMGDNTAVPASMTKDLGGAPRIQGATVDMGAYENAGFVLATSIGTENADLACQSGDWTYYANSTSGDLMLAMQSPDASRTVSAALRAEAVELSRPFGQDNNFHIIRRSWTAHAPDPASPVTVRFFYQPADLAELTGAPDITKVFLYKISGDDAYDTNAGNYLSYKYSSAPASLTTFTTGIFQGLNYVEFLVENFSSGTLALVSDPLPVTLVHFGGASNEGKNRLEWSTEAETGFSYFEIERSTDARTWKTLGSIPSSEGDLGIKHYTYTDSSPFRLSYYRLKMVDADSSYAYSRAIRITTDGATQAGVIYPNPAKTEVWVQTSDAGILRIYDTRGRLIRAQYVNAGINAIDIRRMAAGMYMARINGEAIRFLKEAGE